MRVIFVQGSVEEDGANGDTICVGNIRGLLKEPMVMIEHISDLSQRRAEVFRPSCSWKLSFGTIHIGTATYDYDLFVAHLYASAGK